MDNYVLVITECCYSLSCDVTASLHFLVVSYYCAGFSDANFTSVELD
jgi:hypothetical protein